MSEFVGPKYANTAMYLASSEEKAIDLARYLDLDFEVEYFVTPKCRTIKGRKVGYLFLTEEVWDTPAALSARITTLQGNGVSLLVLGNFR